MKLIEIIAPSSDIKIITAVASQQQAQDFRLGLTDKEGLQNARLLTSDDRLQSTLDGLQTVLGTHPQARILVMPIELSLPKQDEDERKKEDSALAAREALYSTVQKNARLDWNFILLVVLSTIVAAIGLIENNVAVVIGAMVIAPLLGPNLAFGLGTALADTELMWRSFISLLVGVLVAISLSAGIGLLWRGDILSTELLARTDVGLDSAALALVSGAAAALSLATGLSSVLVGVMVAVALLPPATTFGLMLGYGRMDLAAGAGLLFAVNVVCVNLACKLVFLFRGIAPLAWKAQQNAKRTMLIYILIWVITLLLLIFTIYLESAGAIWS
ncbi:MAG: TIGR00341 family protein [Gammaproteobacteria bacterium]|nr:TIGR00341 family protein [Gammaproteobacteria bacterium]